jgi:hypothetical protein
MLQQELYNPSSVKDMHGGGIGAEVIVDIFQCLWSIRGDVVGLEDAEGDSPWD